MDRVEKRQCAKCNNNFILEQDDFSFYKKMQVPAPKACPDCRFKMRAQWRNETSLYSGRKCDLCGQSIISMFHPDLPYKVYCFDCYFSDKWDPEEYKIDYDPNLSFFDQYNELLKRVPKCTLYRTAAAGPNVNSDYVNMAGGVKNCYLVFNTGPAEECMYSRGIRESAEICDGYFSVNSEYSYEIINTQLSNKICWGKNITNCSDCIFTEDSHNCFNCFGCVNLRNKSYYFFNKPMSQEEYKQKVSEIMGSYSKIEDFKKKYEKFLLQFPKKENNNLKTENSIGDYLYETKNVKNSFEVSRSENCRYMFSTKDTKDSIGATGYGFKAELLCEVVAVGYSSNVIGSFTIDESQNIKYSLFCSGSQNLFGCDSLRKKKYCILNKQYTKDEYEKITKQITEELIEKDLYGLMIPPELSPFGYNETIAQDNFPLTKEEALSQGYKWQDDVQKTEGKETLQFESIPDHINDVDDSITSDVLKCIDCSRNYKITNQELTFYRRLIIPIPRKCFYCRHKDRIKRRGPYKFWQRKCDKCKKEITTNFDPKGLEIVYCEECYQKEVY